MKLQLHNLESVVKKRKRVGRGGSRGGTSCKGHKGQNARSGGPKRPGFEGGQMPLYRRVPKRGFINALSNQEVIIVNVQQFNDLFENGAVIDRNALLEHGIIKLKKGIRDHNVILKVLSDGELKKKVTVIANAFSKAAKKAIEDLGGEARLIGEK